MDAPSVLVQVELTAQGVARARHQLDQIEALVGSAGTSPTKAALAGITDQPDVVTLYEHALTVPNSRTPRLLELFAREDPVTPEEIGIELGNGNPLSKSQGRAILRNLLKMEGHLVDRGLISGRLVEKHFARYAHEGAGRYGLSDSDRAALRAYLGT